MTKQLEELTIADVRQIAPIAAKLAEEAPPAPVHWAVGKVVILRTYSAGVHVGLVIETRNEAKNVVLNKSYRVWSWQGAFTLTNVARGISGGRIAGPAPGRLEVTEVIEIIEMTEDAVASVISIAE